MMEEKVFLPRFRYHQVLEKQLNQQSAYDRIYKGDYQSEEVVLKVLEDIDKEDVKREASFLSKLIHPNIVQFKSICLEESSIVLEYMAFDFKKYGVNCRVHSLNELIKQLTKSKFTGYENVIVEIAKGALSGVSFLHSKGVPHRDLKPIYILISNKRNDPGIKVKLCDFGESWGNTELATNYKKTHTTSIYKGLLVTVVKSYKCIGIKSKKT